MEKTKEIKEEEVKRGYAGYQGILLTDGTLTSFKSIFDELGKDPKKEYLVWVTDKKSKSKPAKITKITMDGTTNRFLQITTTLGDKFYTLSDNQILTTKGYKKVDNLTLNDALVYCESKKSTEKIKISSISVVSYSWEEPLYQIELADGGENIALLGGMVVHI